MSLNWDWKNKMGECVYENGHVSNLYQGNAFVIAVNEFEDNTYNLAWFASDENHMKNMLGLSKDYNPCFHHFGIKKLRLNLKYRNTPKLVQLIARAKLVIEIELYKEGDEQ